MVNYLDSSMALRHILLGDETLLKAFETGPVYSSELLEIECRRVLHRYRLEAQLDDQGLVTALRRLEELLGGITLLQLNSPVKKRAMEAFPTAVKTLDALHLSTALQLKARFPEESVVLWTFDRGMDLCAQALPLR